MVQAMGSEDAVTAARRRSALLEVLRQASIDKDIVDDVADACEIKEYTVLHLACPELEAETVAQELYLTDEEASNVQEICRAYLREKGITLLEGGELPSPLEDDEEPADAPEADMPAAEEDEEAGDMPEVAEEDVVEASGLSSHAVEHEMDITDGKENLDPADDHEELEHDVVSEAVEAVNSMVMAEEEVETISAFSVPEPIPSEEPSVVPSDTPGSAVHQSPNSPSRKSTPNNSKSKSATQRRPQSAPPKSIRMKANENEANVPSYMRATTAAQKKIKEESSNDATLKQRPTSASVTISPSLLRPTAASKAWSALKTPVSKARTSLASSAALDGQLSSGPQKLLPTTPKPFNLRTSSLKTSPGLTTDELRIQQAKAQMQQLNEKRKKLSRVQSAPPKPKAPVERGPTQFKPFALSSMQLHEKAQSQWAAQAMEEKKREEEARKFKARPVTYNKGKSYSEVMSNVEQNVKKERKVTLGKEPVFRSQQRIEDHKRLEEEKKAREAEQAAMDAEDRKRAEEKEEQDLKEMRKKLQFHAKQMPNFDTFWQPDKSLSTPPTKGVAPEFECDKRLGRRESTETEGGGLVDVPYAENLNFFAKSLRSPAPDSTTKKVPNVKDLRVTVKAHL